MKNSWARHVLLPAASIAAAAVAVFFAVTAFAQTFVYSLPAGAHLISLPSVVNSPTIKSAEDLFAVIPNVELIAILDPIDGVQRIYDGFCDNADPGAAAECGSSCFCIDPTKGLGVQVVVNAPSEFEINGCDNRQLEIRMTNSSTLISLPFSSPLADAQALLNQLSNQASQQNVIGAGGFLVSDFVDSFDTNGSGTNFPLVPGQGYFVGAPIDDASPTLEWTYRPAATIVDDPDCDIECGNTIFPECDGACPVGEGCEVVIDSGCECIELTPGACCTNGPNTESDCILTTQDVCESEGGLFLGEGVPCAEDPLFCTVLAVTLESAEAVAVRGGVEVRWTTATETDTVGFRLLRQDPGSREKMLRIVASMIPAAGNEFSGSSYEFVDRSAGAGRAVAYYLEEIDIWGRVTRFEAIPVQRRSRSVEAKPGRTRER